MKRIGVVLAIMVVVVAGCGEATEENPPTASLSSGTPIAITATDFAFSETTISLDQGESVVLTLQNDGAAEHSFTSEELGVDVEAHAGESAEGTFTVPDADATFAFFCRYHPDQMTGEVIVGAGGADSGDTAPTDEGTAENDDGYDY